MKNVKCVCFGKERDKLPFWLTSRTEQTNKKLVTVVLAENSLFSISLSEVNRKEGCTVVLK